MLSVYNLRSLFHSNDDNKWLADIKSGFDEYDAEIFRTSGNQGQQI